MVDEGERLARLEEQHRGMRERLDGAEADLARVRDDLTGLKAWRNRCLGGFLALSFAGGVIGWALTWIDKLRMLGK